MHLLDQDLDSACHHDTRYCYLGKRRLSGLERELPDEAFVLGVDEHTAVELDLAAGTATVVGNGRLTVRRQGSSVVYPSGSVLDLDDLAKGTGGTPARPTPLVTAPAEETAGETAEVAQASLRADTDRAVAAFDAALAARDVDGCVAAILDLEQALTDWSADTLTSDEGDHARASLRRMVLRLGELASVGARDPAEVVGPYVQALLDVRARAREAGDYASSDRVRDRLAEAGVEVRDTPAGAEWQL